jgi:uncharacterized protein YaaN involved in tellurite resistance
MRFESEVATKEAVVGSTPDVKNEVMAFDLNKTKNEIIAQVNNRAELETLTDQIDLSDVTTIVNFGKEAAEGISKCSDSVLNMVEMDKINQTGDMMKSLTKIMSSFDPKELSTADTKKGFMPKLFNNAKSQLEKVLAKYDTMGGQVDNIYTELKKYEAEINSSNNKIEQLFDANIDFYKKLEQYILACSIGYEMIDDYKAKLENQMAETGDNSLQFKLQSVDMGKQMLQQREQDLRIAENVALQTLPMLKQMQYSNLNLVRKINSAFIITLPVFKQSLAQAVLLKRQQIQAESMAALDEKTNEMLRKNAENAANQAKLTTQLATGSSIKMETLEYTWNTIMQGAEDCRTIAEDNARKREEDKVKLIEFKKNILEKANIK